MLDHCTPVGTESPPWTELGVPSLESIGRECELSLDRNVGQGDRERNAGEAKGKHERCKSASSCHRTLLSAVYIDDGRLTPYTAA
jgi:hypothetical protein